VSTKIWQEEKFMAGLLGNQRPAKQLQAAASGMDQMRMTFAGVNRAAAKLIYRPL
jgi:hypothetical protein